MINFYVPIAPDLLLQRDNMGNTALHTAAAYGTFETVQLLIQHAVDHVSPHISVNCVSGSNHLESYA